MIPIMGFAAVWLVQRMVGGDLEVLPGITGLFMIAVLFGVAVLVPEQKMAGPIVVLVVALMVFFPFAETEFEKHEMFGIDAERIDKAHQELAVRPDNASARFALARALYERGLAGHAIAIAENALSNLSAERDVMSLQSMRDKFRNEEYELRRWKKEALDPRLFEPVACPKCGADNAPGTIECSRCRGPYLLELARKKSGTRAIYGRMIVGFATTAALLVVASYIGLNVAWPGSVFGLGLAVIVIGLFLGWIFRPRTLRN